MHSYNGPLNSSKNAEGIHVAEEIGQSLGWVSKQANYYRGFLCSWGFLYRIIPTKYAKITYFAIKTLSIFVFGR